VGLLTAFSLSNPKDGVALICLRYTGYQNAQHARRDSFLGPFPKCADMKHSRDSPAVEPGWLRALLAMADKEAKPVLRY